MKIGYNIPELKGYHLTLEWQPYPLRKETIDTKFNLKKDFLYTLGGVKIQVSLVTTFLILVQEVATLK